jgi:hypothetical protein
MSAYWTNLALPNSFSASVLAVSYKLHLLHTEGIFWLLSLLFQAVTFEFAAPQTLSDFGMYEHVGVNRNAVFGSILSMCFICRNIWKWYFLYNYGFINLSYIKIFLIIINNLYKIAK